jgi:hypothetical protein
MRMMIIRHASVSNSGPAQQLCLNSHWFHRTVPIGPWFTKGGRQGGEAANTL